MVQARQVGQTAVRRQGRRVIPSVRRYQTRAVAAGRQTLTLGDLIAAAYDTAGPQTRSVARILKSVSMAQAIDRRIVIE